MTKKIILIAGIITYSFVAQAQYKFQHLFGGINQERGQTLFPTFDSGYIFNGATTSYGTGSADAFLVKTDAQGNLIWSMAYGTATYDNSEFSLQTYDNNIICLGRSNILTTSSATDVMFFKTNSGGNLLWSKAYGGINNDGATRAVELPDHGYAIIGSTQSYGAGSSDVLFIRTDENGDTLFTRIFGSPILELAISIAPTSDAGFIIAGRSVDNLLADAMLIRTDSAGNLIWSKTYGDSLWDEAQSAKQTADGGFIVCGSTYSYGSGKNDILLLKTDSLGDVEWAKTYGGTDEDASYNVIINPDGSYTVSGYTNSMGYGHQMNKPTENNSERLINPSLPDITGDDSTNAFLMKTDSNGDTIWTRSYGDGFIDEAYLSEKASDGGYLISGYTSSYTGDSTQMLFIKTDSLGFSGCHEMTSHPSVGIAPFIAKPMTYSQASGISVSSISLTQTNIITNDDDACLLTSINHFKRENGVELFPNPTGDGIYLHFKETQDLNIYLILMDIENRTIPFSKLKSVSGGNDFYLDLSFLKPGIYILQMINNENTILTRKIVKI